MTATNPMALRKKCVAWNKRVPPTNHKNGAVCHRPKENYIVNPDQVEVLDATENATITLITCTVGSKQRVIVKGTLQSTEDL